MATSRCTLTTRATLTAFIEKFRSMWTCSEANVEKDGGGFRIHQESYIRFMMAKHEIEGITATGRGADRG